MLESRRQTDEECEVVGSDNIYDTDGDEKQETGEAVEETTEIDPKDVMDSASAPTTQPPANS